MAEKKYKPTSPGRRHGSGRDDSNITKEEPEKSLTTPLPKSGGRNNFGHSTIKKRGGGHKRRYRVIDFKRDKDGVPAEVAAIEYDPNRNVDIALLKYEDGDKRYILCPRDLEVGDTVESGEDVEPSAGNCMPLRSIPTGLKVHNIELKPNAGGELVRSAGGMATLRGFEGRHAIILLPSKELRKVHKNCRATIGQLGNIDANEVELGKAGRNRHLGKKPNVTGNSMNPVSHPMGGGEGHRSGGRHPCSRTGHMAKGGKTRRDKKQSSDLIIRGRERGTHQR